MPWIKAIQITDGTWWDYIAHCIDKLLDVLNLLLLANDCLHCLLAHCLVNPYLPLSLCNIPLLMPCPNDDSQCSYCNSISLASQLPQIIKTSVKICFLLCFYGWECYPKSHSRTFSHPCLSTTFCIQPHLMFGWKAMNKPKPLAILKRSYSCLYSCKDFGLLYSFCKRQWSKETPNCNNFLLLNFVLD